MKRLSISKAWDDSRPIIAQDFGLMFSVALATVVVPGTLLFMLDPSSADISAATQAELERGADTGDFIISLISALIGLIGSIAISYLALRSGASVGEALRRGLHRLLPTIGAVLLLIVPIVLIAFVLVLASGGGVETLTGEASAETPTPSAGVAFASLAFIIAAIYVGVRLAPMTPVIAAEDGGPIAILKRTWSLTKGQFARLFGFMILFAIGAFIVIVGVALIANLALALMFGDPEPMSVGALAYGLVATILQAVVTIVYSVMVARIYLQLSVDPNAGPRVPNVNLD